MFDLIEMRNRISRKLENKSRTENRFCVRYERKKKEMCEIGKFPNQRKLCLRQAI